MKRIRMELMIFSIIIFNIVFVAISTTISAFCDFYEYENNFKVESPKLMKKFSSYTGFDTGYGFFAPNVSSNFIILSKDIKNNRIFASSELLSTSEGKSRFLNINDIFLRNLDNPEKETLEINHTILKQINKYFSQKYNSKFETNVFLYDYPSLHNYKNNKKLLIKFDSIIDTNSR